MPVCVLPWWSPRSSAVISTAVYLGRTLLPRLRDRGVVELQNPAVSRSGVSQMSVAIDASRYTAAEPFSKWIAACPESRERG